MDIWIAVPNPMTTAEIWKSVSILIMTARADFVPMVAVEYLTKNLSVPIEK